MSGRQLARRTLNALGADFAAYVGLKQCSNGIFFRTVELSSSSSPRAAEFSSSSSSSSSSKLTKPISTRGAFSTSSQLAAPAASNAKRVLGEVRNNWTKEEIREMYSRPLLELVFDAATVHRMHHDPQTSATVHVTFYKNWRVPGNVQLLRAIFLVEERNRT